HDLHPETDADATFQDALMMHHTAVAEARLGADHHLMPALETMPDDRVGVDHRTTPNDGVVADPRRLPVARIAVTKNHPGIDPPALSNLIKTLHLLSSSTTFLLSYFPPPKNRRSVATP